MTLRTWPRHKQLTENQTRYVLSGLPRALDEGWYRYEWVEECAALFGVPRDAVASVCFDKKGPTQ